MPSILNLTIGQVPVDQLRAHPRNPRRGDLGAIQAMELEPHFVDVAVRRWQSVTGQRALREDGSEFPASP